MSNILPNILMMAKLSQQIIIIPLSFSLLFFFEVLKFFYRLIFNFFSSIFYWIKRFFIYQALLSNTYTLSKISF